MEITANDEPTEIEADVDKRFSSIIVNLPVQQTGTGTPSPSNPRPFTMWTDVSLYVSDAETADDPTLAIQLPTPMYGGKVDMVRGEIATTYNSKESGTGWEMTEEGQFRCQVSAYNNGDETSTDVADLYAVHYETVSNKDAYDATDDLTCGLATIAGTTYLYVNDAQYTTLESFATHIADEVFVFRAHIPMSDVTEPHIVYLPEGTSYVWADAGFVDYTVSGTPPLSLPNSLGKPLKAWSVDVLPYQEGTGDPSPSNARPIHGTDKLTITTAGKNLGHIGTDNYATGQYFTAEYKNGGAVITSTASYGRAGYSIPVKAGNQYTISLKAKRNGNAYAIQFNDSNEFAYNLWVVVPTETMTTYSRTITATSDILFVGIYPNATDASITVEDFQLEFGSTATAYTPYLAPSQSVIDVPPLSANKWDKVNIQDGYISDDDGEVKSTAPYKNTGYVEVLPSASYYICTEQTNGAWGAWYDADKRFITGVTGYIQGSQPVITSPSNAKYVRLTLVTYDGGNPDTFGINYPSTVTTYNPYNATVYTGTIGSDGGESRDAMVDMGTLNWARYTNTENPVYYARMTNAKPNVLPVMCSGYTPTFWHQLGDLPDCYIQIHPALNIAYVRDDRYETAEAFKAGVNGVQLLYQLDPTTQFPLTSPTIPTPTGTATTWATAEDGTVDSMSVTYVRKV